MTTTDEVIDFLDHQLADADAGWSVGTFGAIAEFTRGPKEPVNLNRTANTVSAVTDRGGVQIVAHAGLRLIASESPTTESWSHRIALCLPRETCAMNKRSVFTELGADCGALRAEDRDSVLFDLGLDVLQIDACVRVNDPAVVSALRNCTGKSLFAPDTG